MDGFYEMDISEENKIKIKQVQKAIPENIRDFIPIEKIQELLKTNINELETQMTTLFSELGMDDTKQIKSTCEAVKKIMYPPKTTKINNNNIKIVNVNVNSIERGFIGQIKNAVCFDTNASVQLDDDIARRLLKETDRDMKKATLNSVFEEAGVKIDETTVTQILNDIKEITSNYQSLRAKVLPNSSKNQIKNTAQNRINSETYATDPYIVSEVSNKFKLIFNCKKDLSRDDVKKLLMSDASKRKNVLSSIIDKYQLKKKNGLSLLSSLFQDNKDPSDSFLSYIGSIIIEFYKSSNKKKGTTQTDKIFSDEAVDSIINYFKTEHKNYKYDRNDNAIDFANEIFEPEVTDNRMSRFSLKQINKMLSSGVSPDCLLAICNFDIYIKYKHLDKDISSQDNCGYLCGEFIDFLYMYIDKRCINKTDPDNEPTPQFAQNLISKYIKDKKLNKLEQIKSDPVICSLFYKKDGNLRDKEQINKLLGSDEKIFEMFMKANINKTLLENVLNINILWEFSNDWLSQIRNTDYSDTINFMYSQKKSMTFKLIDLLDSKNTILNKLLEGKTVKCGNQKFTLNQNQIAQTKAIKFIAPDLEMIESYLNSNKDKNRACLDALKKIFSHRFWFDKLVDVNFFTRIVTFLKKEILVDELDEQNINDIYAVDDLKNILNAKTISHLFANVKSDFVMSVLLDSVLGDYLKIGSLTAQHFAEIFEAVFGKVYNLNKNFDFKRFKKVFIKTFVAKTKNMKRKNFWTKNNDGTVLQFILDQMKQINQLLQEKNKEYTFDNDEIDYFNICFGVIEDQTDLEEPSQNENVIYDQDVQKSMDSFIFDFLRRKFNLREEIKNEIVENNKNKNENKIKIESNEIKKENDQKKERTDNKEEKFINHGDYLTDEEINNMFGTKNQTNKENEKQHISTKEDKEKTKTNEMKIECIVDLYNIDKEIVKEITDLDRDNLLGLRDFLHNLQAILNRNEYRSQKVQNSIKKCYIDQFFFSKAFTKIALMMHNKTQKDSNGTTIDFKSNYKTLFERLFNDKKDTDGNKKNVFDQEDISYFWTVWEKRQAYFNNQINLAKIGFKIDNKESKESYPALYSDEEYEKQYSQGIMNAKKKYGLDKEILKSKNEIQLDKYNLHINIIKEIDLQVESLYAASFENFFFGYLSVLKKTVRTVKAEFAEENLADFQKCYIQKFLTWHRDNKNAESIKKQFLLDMHSFFNKNSGNPQNIFGKEVVDYFDQCVKRLFKLQDNNLKLDNKSEPFKSSLLDKIQIIEMDQTKNSSPWLLEYFDAKKMTREERKKIDENGKLISEQLNKQQNREENKVVFFDLSKVNRKLPFEELNEEEKKSEKDNDKKNIEVNISGIDDKNLIKNEIQKINQEVKINDLDNKKENAGGNNITNTNTNDISVENNTKNPIEIEKIENKSGNNNPRENKNEQNNIKEQYNILPDKEKLENNIKKENDLTSQTCSITEINNFDSVISSDINSQHSQDNQTIKINCLSNCDVKNEQTEYMSILHGLDTNIINGTDVAISNLRFSQNFDLLSPLNQILNTHSKHKETQIKRYYIDRFFGSDIFKTHMQEEKFESMFGFQNKNVGFQNKNVFDDNDVNYFKNQWRKTVLLHFDSQQFKNQKLEMNKNFCFDMCCSPGNFHNIPKELVSQISSSVGQSKYNEPEDFFRGYHVLFKSGNLQLLNKSDELGVQKYYIESFLLNHMQQNHLDTKFLRHVDFRFRGYLLKKQMVFDDEAIKYFYELLEKLLSWNEENKENKIVNNELRDKTNGLKIKDFEVNITTSFIEKQKFEKNCHNYKVAFWFLSASAVLSCVIVFVSVYSLSLALIFSVCDIFCFKKQKDNKTELSNLIKTGGCLISLDKIKSYKNLVANDVVCDEKINYCVKMQENKQDISNKFLEFINKVDVKDMTQNKS